MDDGLAGQAAVERQSDDGLEQVAFVVGVTTVGVSGLDAADAGEERPVHAAGGILLGEDALGVAVGGVVDPGDAERALLEDLGLGFRRGGGLEGAHGCRSV